LRGVGNPRIAMALMLGGAGLNMALDPLLIFGWGVVPALGVAGAALASVISFAATFLGGLLVFFGGHGSVRLHFRGASPISAARMLRMLRIGVPSGISSLSFSLSRAVIMPIVAGFGPVVVAAYGMSNRVTALGVMAVVGMGLGVSALTGQNLGAGKLDRTWSIAVTSARLGTAVLTALAFGTILAARPIASMFFDTPEMVALGAGVLRILSLSLPFAGLFIPMENCCVGAGQTRAPMAFSIAQAWALQIPFVLLSTMVMRWDERSVWWSLVVSEAVATGFFAAYFRRRSWIHTRV
jgi:putative MATE family efflux protein